jgi:hypothetical protein
VRVSLRLQKLSFSMAIAGCLTTSIAVVVWAVRAPLPSDATDNRSSGMPSSATAAEVELTVGPSREDFAQLCNQPLRRVLYDPPPPKPEVRELPPLDIELLGTILEGENSMAMVRSQQGQVEYKRTGDSLGPTEAPANILEITGDAIVLERSGERVTLKVRGSELH